MRYFLNNYKNTILLILALIIGAISGVIFKEDVNVVKPLGDLFLNALFVTIVPLLFLTITTTIAKMDSKGRLKKIFGRIILISLITSLIAIMFGILTTNTFKLVNPNDTKIIPFSHVNDM